ncbi:hypothetical protein HYU94_03040 [Candidatus Daviesbacteria bacterium]|nr:hypothetical protein [Candidatus Daviesbacteria bacterium]
MKKETIIKFYSDFKLYIFPFIVALSSIFLIVFAIYPQTFKLITDHKLAENFSNKANFLETKVTALEGFDQEDLSQKVELTLISLPAEKDIGNIFGLLQNEILKSGFSVSAISLGNSGGKVGGSDSYELKVEIKGAKRMFPILLNNLEDSPRLIRINSIDISSRQSGQEIDAALILGVLYSSAPSNFGTADSPLPEISREDEELLAKLAEGSSVPQAPEQPQSSSSRGRSNPFD